MAHDVFISYSSKDRDTSDMICRYLEGQGVSCWVAPRDITPGQDWAEAIVDAIGGSKLMLLVFSSHANDSSQINREISIASEGNIPIVPFRIEDIQPSRRLKYYLSTPHWLDALPPPVEGHLEYLGRSIRRFIPVDEKEKKTPAPGRETSRHEPPVEKGEQKVSPQENTSQKAAFETGLPPAEQMPPRSGDQIPSFSAATEDPVRSQQVFPAVRRHPFSFDEEHEKASVSKTYQIIGLAAAACFFFLIAAFWTRITVRSSEQALVIFVWSFLNFLLYCAISWLVVYLAKTRPIFAPLCSLAAATTVLCLNNAYSLIGGMDDDFRVGIYLLTLPFMIVVAVGVLAKSPVLWLYGMLLSFSMIFFGVFAYRGVLRLLIPVAIVTLIATLYAAQRHRQNIVIKQSRKQDGR